ncbi:MAG: MoaD/ThiS family protein [Lysobacterales bacterium]|nr:MAG: MoaD/ThiS family protein [Xanthomonadales bacterium]
MNVQVSYFAAFREAAGVATERIDTASVTAAALFDECAGRHPALQRYSASLVAINDEMSPWDTALAEGDEVLFFPPVAGG